MALQKKRKVREKGERATPTPPSLHFSLSCSIESLTKKRNKKNMKQLFSRGSAAKHDFEVTLHSVSPWPAEAASDVLVVSWRRGARRAGSVVAAGTRSRRVDDGDDSSTVALELSSSGATVSVPATMYKVKGR